MKKLSLKSLNFGANELLKREQLKTVFGGYGYGCAYQGGNGYAGLVGPNVIYAQAEHGSTMTGGHFCCASCCTVGWLSQSDKAYLGC